MRRLILLVPFIAMAALALDAPSAFQPPAKAAEAVEKGLSASVADTYLDHVAVIHEYRGFEGQNARLKAESLPERPLKIGEGFPVALASEAFFTDVFEDEGLYIYSAALRSVDALALRVRVDLSQLAPGDDVWVLDPITGHSFGPFTRADHHEDGFWLPTIQGDTVVIVARSPINRLPDLEVVEASHHFFQLTATKLLPCHNDLTTIGDPDLLDLASGVGRIATTISGSTWLCTGTLVNNPKTSEFEALLLTANHCVSTVSDALNSEVVWDYRDSTVNLAALPRSNGAALLATNSSLDMTLIWLDDVPTGPHGRTYVGWSTAVPQTDAPVTSLHHPGGSYMRVSFGAVQAVDESSITYNHQIRVGWDSGMTEGGSSGGGLFSAANQIIGTLSNGPTPACGGGADYNYDYFASFGLFFPQVEQYLKNDDPPLPPPSTPIISCNATSAIPATVGGDLAVFALAGAVVIAARVHRKARVRVRVRP
jgi:V8-like Glu-specific endopeptidase